MKEKEIRKNLFCLILAGLMLSSFLLIAPVVAEEPGYENINVRQAKHMIKHTDNILILDVRNQSEYDLGHLSGAVLIPIYALENSTNLQIPINNGTSSGLSSAVIEAVIGKYNILENINDPIIVYCSAGSRSPIACQTLTDHGFTNVYNMIGGIKAWMQAGYSIFTSNHYAEVELKGNHNVKAEIMPLLQHELENQCTTCTENQTCSSEVVYGENFNGTMLEHDEENVVLYATFDIDGIPIELIVNRTALWNYSEFDDGYNRTATLVSEVKTISNIGVPEIVTQTYSLDYRVMHEDFKVLLHTELTSNNTENYDIAYTGMGYAPKSNAPTLLSKEVIEFNTPISLSKHYFALSSVSQKFAHLYERSDNEDLSQLSTGYLVMKNEAKHLSDIIDEHLSAFDKPILNCSSILLDAECDDVCSLACGTVSAGVCLAGCAAFASGCTLGFPVCFGACSVGCGTVSGLFCTFLCNGLCGDEFDPTELGCNIACGGLCGLCPVAAQPMCLVCSYPCGVICEAILGLFVPEETYYVADIDWEGTGCDGGGYLGTPEFIIGSQEDQYFAHLHCSDYGDSAKIVGIMNEQASGHIELYGRDGPGGYYSDLYVFVSSDGVNWNQVGSVKTITQTSNYWIDIGTPQGSFQYIGVAGYDSANSVCLYIDAVRVTP